MLFEPRRWELLNMNAAQTIIFMRPWLLLIHTCCSLLAEPEQHVVTFQKMTCWYLLYLIPATHDFKRSWFQPFRHHHDAADGSTRTQAGQFYYYRAMVAAVFWSELVGKTHTHDAKSRPQFLIILAMKMIKDHKVRCKIVLLLSKTATHLVQICTFQKFPLALWLPSFMETSGSNLVRFRSYVQMIAAHQCKCRCPPS